MNELPHPYMQRCAQLANRGIFEYRDDLIANYEHLRFIGAEFADEHAAQAWDDRPGQVYIDSIVSFPSWKHAEAWLYEVSDG
jgi:hypothetical protein